MQRAPVLRLHQDELIVDSFAGGGGASLGMEWGLGRSPDIAINHDREAIAMHAANHPSTKHFCEDVWKVDPRIACKSRPAFAWFSPDCKHFSKAKGQTMKQVIARLKAGESLRTGYTFNLKAIFENGDVVPVAVMRKMKKAGMIEQDRNGFILLAK